MNNFHPIQPQSHCYTLPQYKYEQHGDELCQAQLKIRPAKIPSQLASFISGVPSTLIGGWVERWMDGWMDGWQRNQN